MADAGHSGLFGLFLSFGLLIGIAVHGVVSIPYLLPISIAGLVTSARSRLRRARRLRRTVPGACAAAGVLAVGWRWGRV